VQLSAVLAIAAPIGLRTGLAVGAVAAGEGAGLALGEVAIPLAAAVYFSQLTDGQGPTTASDWARYLKEAVNLLVNDLLELDALTTLLAITAAEAAALCNGGTDPSAYSGHSLAGRLHCGNPPR
jgi:hypothetical protein